MLIWTLSWVFVLLLFEFFPFISFKSQKSGLARLFISITSDRYYYE